MKNYLLFILIISFQFSATAQNPAPASGKPKRMLLLGGTAHIGNGKVIENSAIGLKDGKITLVTDARIFKPNPSDFDTIINCVGKQLYPGLIALNTTLGINEIELVRSTNDYRESGSLNPGARTIVAYNTDSKITPTVRANGILLAQIAPQGGLISGTSSVVKLDGWNWEDAAYQTDEGIWMNWPSMRIFHFSPNDSDDAQQVRNSKNLQEMTRLFDDAKTYANLTATPIRNPHLEAMRGLFDGSKKLYVNCNFSREIIAAIQFCKLYGIKMVLVGGADSWRVTDQLKENNIPVIIVRTHSLPSRADDDVWLPYKLAGLLKNAGVEFAIANDGFWQVRNLPFQAGTAAGYGLTKEEALTAITLSPAKILGIDKRAGTLEEAKDATLFISTGDALDMRSNHVELAIINGRIINLDNVQSQLYHKYEKKYGFE